MYYPEVKIEKGYINELYFVYKTFKRQTDKVKQTVTGAGKVL